ncbi:hypothetical protein BGZ74_003258 [Mortierella antarctica]|nr:hypothetical protein BGZ74_003258 [Mortierella antarctica]
MTNNIITLFCLVEGETTSNAFSVKISSDNTVHDLKKLIKTEKIPEFDDVAPDKLTLWRVVIPSTDSIPLELIPEKKRLLPTDDISDVFADQPPKKTINIIVERPPPALKRDREGDEGSSSKKLRLGTDMLLDAIEAAGLSEKAVVNGRSALSRLDNNERVSVLKYLGRSISDDNTFNSLPRTALRLQGANIKDMDTISSPPLSRLPVVFTKDLYVRPAFEDLYGAILRNFKNNGPDDPELEEHVVVTGTSGIGKSAFLRAITTTLL